MLPEPFLAQVLQREAGLLLAQLPLRYCTAPCNLAGSSSTPAGECLSLPLCSHPFWPLTVSEAPIQMLPLCCSGTRSEHPVFCRVRCTQRLRLSGRAGGLLCLAGVGIHLPCSCPPHCHPSDSGDAQLMLDMVPFGKHLDTRVYSANVAKLCARKADASCLIRRFNALLSCIMLQSVSSFTG